MKKVVIHACFTAGVLHLNLIFRYIRDGAKGGPQLTSVVFQITVDMLGPPINKLYLLKTEVVGLNFKLRSLALINAWLS